MNLSALFRSLKNSRRRRQNSRIAIQSQTCEVRLVLSASLWTQAGADAGHSAYVDLSPVPGQITTAWNVTTLPSVPGVAVDQDHVFRTVILTSGGLSQRYEIQAHRILDGSLTWKTELIGYSIQAPSVASVFNGKVFVNVPGHSQSGVGREPKLYELDAATGAIVAVQTYGAQFGSNDRPVIQNNLVIAEAGYYGGVTGYRASTLEPLWNNGGSQTIPPKATITGTTIVAYGNRLYAKSDGSPNGTQPDVQSGKLTDAIYSPSGIVFFQGIGTSSATKPAFVTAIDDVTRTTLWTANFDNVRSKAVGNGIVAVASNDKVTLLSETNGTDIRSWNAPAPLIGEIAITNTHVFVQTFQGIHTGTATVHAVNIATGLSEWSYSNTNNSEFPSMSIAIGSGRLVLSTRTKVATFTLGDLTPVVVDEYVEALEDVPTTIAVLNNDRALGGATIASITSASSESGTVTIVGRSIRYRPAANFSGLDRITYTVADSAGRSADGIVTLNIASQIDPAIPVIKAPQTAVEGRSVTFDGSSSTNSEVTAMSYTWQFSDGVVLTGAVVQRSFPDNGTYVATLILNNGVESTRTRSISVSNAVPVLSATGVGAALLNDSFALKLTTTDAAGDLQVPLNYSVDWKDGSAIQQFSGGATRSALHKYKTPGVYYVTSRVTDKDAAMSNPVVTKVVVKSVILNGQVLMVEGTDANDTVTLRPGSSAGSVIAIVNGATAGVFSGVNLIVVSTHGGADSISIQRTGAVSLSIPAMIDAGAGNDSIAAGLSTSGNVLFGGAGSDSIQGGSGRDILIGGLGSDVLRGGGGEDILTGGLMQFDFTPAVFAPIMSEWTRTDATFDIRLRHLIGLDSGGLNGSVILTPGNMLDDRTRDSLFGELDQDWFFGNESGIGFDLYDRNKNLEPLLPIPNV
jgi:hypothetical protein